MGHLTGLLVMLAILGTVLLIKKVTGGTVFPFAMMALSADAVPQQREGVFVYRPVLTGVTIYKGALIVLDSSGYAKPAVTATGLIPDGVAAEAVVNAGASGSVYVKVEKGIFLMGNYASDLCTVAQIGDACYIYDDCQVAGTSGGATRSIAGRIEDVTADGVWVNIGNLLAANGDLVATNNLSDVSNAGTARTNLGLGNMAVQAKSAVDITGGTVVGITDLAIADGGTGVSTAALARAALGANLVTLQIHVTTLVGTNVYRAVSPVAGTITKIQSVINGILTVGDATLTGKIGANAITDGEITIANAGSAAGDVDTVNPSAANVVAIGNVISVTVGGTNATASGADVTILIAT